MINQGSADVNAHDYSSKAFKPLTVKVNNINHLAVVQYSNVTPWILTFMWLSLDTNHPAEHPHGTSTP